MRSARFALRPSTSLGAVLLLGLFAACGGGGDGGSAGGGDDGDGGGGAGAKPVSTSTLEQHVQDNFSPDEGVELAVDCPEALEPKVDATAICTVDDGEGQTGLRFVTTEIDGDEVSYETTPFLTSQTVETSVIADMESQGYAVSDMVCPDDLDGVVDETTECRATSKGVEATIKVRVSQVEGLRVGLAWEAGE